MNQLSAGLSTVPNMDENQFIRWQNLLEERTGMCLKPQRRTFLQSNLNVRMRELGYKSMQEYYQLVTTGPAGAIEWNTLVDRLTVQETRFFRDPDALAFVEQYVQKFADQSDGKETFEFWSVGCSTGEEPYTFAMIGERYLAPKNIRYSVTGTDISTYALRKARKGIYPAKALQFIPESYQHENISFDDSKKNIELSARLHERCCFSQVNVLNLASYPLHSLQVIYCQNVLIYFRRWRRREILNNLAERLAPGGILVIGLGEMVDYQHPLLEPIRVNNVSAFMRKKQNNEEERG